jgi:hypothetical protein
MEAARLQPHTIARVATRGRLLPASAQAKGRCVVAADSLSGLELRIDGLAASVQANGKRCNVMQTRLL